MAINLAKKSPDELLVGNNLTVLISTLIPRKSSVVDMKMFLCFAYILNSVAS